MAAYAIQFRRGTTTQHNSFTGLLGEVTVDTDKKTLVVHDGSTTGGFPLAREGAASTASTGTFTSNVTVGGTFSVTSTTSFGDDVTITGDLGMTGHIIPSANVTYDLGSTTMMWRDVYVGPGSLYINGQKVLEDNSGTIKMSADANQNIKIESTGTGALQFVGAGGIQVSGEVNALTGDLQFGDHLDMNSNRIKEVSAPVDGSDAANKTYVDGKISSMASGGTLSFDGVDGDFSGDLTVGGNVTISGTTTTINTTQINLADNILLLNSDATGSASANAGIEVERGDDLNVQLLWDESSNRWTVGSENLYTSGSFIGDLTGDVTGDVTGTVSSLANHDTGDLSEGTNLYFTNSRVDTRLASGNVATLKTGEFEVSSNGMTVDVDVAIASNMTISGGSTMSVANSGGTNVFVVNGSTGGTTIAGPTIVNNDFSVKNSSNTNVFDIDVANSTFDVDLDLTVNNSATFKNNFAINNSSNTTLFDIDVSNATFDVDLDMTVNNSATFKNDFSVTNSSNTNLFDIDVANTLLDIDLDMTVNNIATFKNNFAINNSSNTTLFDIDVSNATFDIDLDMTVNNSATFNNNLTVNNSNSTTMLDIDVTNATFDIDLDMTVNNSATFNNNLTINNSSSVTKVDIDVTANTYDIDMDLTVNNASTFNNNLTINNTSSTTMVDIDVVNATFDIDMALTVNNATTVNNNFTVNNTSSTTVFDIDVTNTTLDIDLDVTINNEVTINNNLTLGGDLTLSTSAEDTIKDLMSQTHATEYVVTSSDATNNASATASTRQLSAATLGFNAAGAAVFMLFLNRQLLRQSEYSVDSSGNVTFAQNLLAADDEIEAVIYK